MSFITTRTDVSDWLIHFVRERDPETDFHFVTEEDDDSWYGGLEPDASPESVLRNIIDIGGLLPGYSFRKQAGNVIKTTIYGGEPVVCFTEAPLLSFVQYVNARGALDRCAPYALCFLRSEVFAAGGRPVIYGLAGGTPPLVEDEPFRRIVEPSILPLAEQFRYVAYDPNRSRPLDWTHEREWRWVAGKKDSHTIWHSGPEGDGPYPALPLFLGVKNGGFFSRIGIIAATDAFAQEISESLLRYRDTGHNNFCTPYDPDVLANSFVVSLESAPAVARIEDLEPKFRLIPTRPAPSSEMIQRVAGAVAKARVQSLAAGKTHKGWPDVVGGAWVITSDSTSEVVAALLAAGLAESVGGLYYRVDAVARGAASAQDLNHHEAVAQAACDSLCGDLGDIFTVRTYWD